MFEPGDDLLRSPRLVVPVEAQEPRVDSVVVEEDPRTAGVLAEDEIGLAQLLEHAERDVVEVADRGGADRERHRSAALYQAPSRA